MLVILMSLVSVVLANAIPGPLEVPYAYVDHVINNADRTNNREVSDPVILGEVVGKKEKGMDLQQFRNIGMCKDNIAQMCFDDIDTDRDGYISPPEMINYEQHNTERVRILQQQYYNSMFQKADVNHDGFITQKESRRFAQAYLHVIPDSNWRRFFNYMDANLDDELEPTEFNQLLDTYSDANVPLHFDFSKDSYL